MVLTDVGGVGRVAGEDVVIGYELGGGEADLDGDLVKLAGGGGAGEIVDLRVLAGRNRALPASQSRSVAPRLASAALGMSIDTGTSLRLSQPALAAGFPPRGVLRRWRT